MLIPIGGVCSRVKQLREVRQERIGSILGDGTVVYVIVIVPLRKSMLIWKPRKKSRPSKPSTWDVGGRVWERTGEIVDGFAEGFKPLHCNARTEFDPAPGGHLNSVGRCCWIVSQEDHDFRVYQCAGSPGVQSQAYNHVPSWTE
jgi:hypothetical protein